MIIKVMSKPAGLNIVFVQPPYPLDPTIFFIVDNIRYIGTNETVDIARLSV